MAHHRLLDDLGLSGAAGPDGEAFDDISSEDDFFTFIDIETISSSGPSDRDRDCGAETSSPLCPKHYHNNFVDGAALRRPRRGGQ